MGKGNEERATWIGTYPSLTFWICPVCGRKGNYIDLSGLLRNDNYIRLSGLQPFALCPKNCFVPEKLLCVRKCQL